MKPTDEVLYCSLGNHYWKWVGIGNIKTRKYSIEHLPNFRGKSLANIACPIHYDMGKGLVRNFEVTNPRGIHARPSTEVVIFASRYIGENNDDYIKMVLNNNIIKASSILEVMTSEAKQGSKFQIIFPERINKTNPGLLEEICLGIYHAATTELD